MGLFGHLTVFVPEQPHHDSLRASRASQASHYTAYLESGIVRVLGALWVVWGATVSRSDSTMLDASQNEVMRSTEGQNNLWFSFSGAFTATRYRSRIDSCLMRGETRATLRRPVRVSAPA